MDGVTYSHNFASRQAIAHHLQTCDDQFIPALSSRVDIDEYSKKIKDFAHTFEAWCDEQLVGLVASYQNAELRKVFITSVSTIPSFRGAGIGFSLMTDLIKYCHISNVSRIELEVNNQSSAGIFLYEKIGFHQLPPNEKGVVKMMLTIKNYTEKYE